MKEEIKNGYFFMYENELYLRVGSRAYIYVEFGCYKMFKYIEEDKIQAIYKPNGERVG